MTIFEQIKERRLKIRIVVACLFISIIGIPANTMAQQTNQMVRFAKIKVDSAQLEMYNVALKKQMTTAIEVEPGVLSYYAVADKSDPTNITILEIYADKAAYEAHIATPHFKLYKDTVKDMVKSLELTDLTVIASAKKPGM